jgi:hypothetical protein
MECYIYASAQQGQVHNMDWFRNRLSVESEVEVFARNPPVESCNVIKRQDGRLWLDDDVLARLRRIHTPRLWQPRTLQPHPQQHTMAFSAAAIQSSIARFSSAPSRVILALMLHSPSFASAEVQLALCSLTGQKGLSTIAYYIAEI